MYRDRYIYPIELYSKMLLNHCQQRNWPVPRQTCRSCRCYHPSATVKTADHHMQTDPTDGPSSGIRRFRAGSDDKYDGVFGNRDGLASAVSFSLLRGTDNTVPSSLVTLSTRIMNCSEKCFLHTTVLSWTTRSWRGITRIHLARISSSPAAKPKNMVEYFTLWRNYETWHTYRGPL